MTRRGYPGVMGVSTPASAGPVRRPHVAHPGALARGELVVAGVVGVVHVVVDRVQARQRAGVAALGAAARRAGLRRGVAHLVVRRGATALEGVVQPEPVAGLVGRGLAEVVVGVVATRDRAVVHPDAVDARVVRVVPRERGDAEVGEVDQPDVQRVRPALAGLRAVGRALAVLVPLVVVPAVGAGQREGEAGVGGLRRLLAGVGLVQHRDLVGDLLVGDVAGAVGGSHHVHVDRNGRAGQRALRHVVALLALGLQDGGGAGLDGALLVEADRAGVTTRAAFGGGAAVDGRGVAGGDRKSTRLNSSHVAISYAVFC